MIVIRTIQDLRELEQRNTLPSWYVRYLDEFFMLLFTTYHHEQGLQAFSLTGIAEIVILEAYDNPHDLCLPMIPGSPGLMEMGPEHVDKIRLGDKGLYRITFMPDNERMVFVFSEVGQLEPGIEEWLSDQYEWSTMFVNEAAWTSES